ncbi:MAG: acetylxylan esterase [Bryobacterales bacterium]|nr:acetylxylan esterase [Bryobacterales bacterium]
MKRTLLLLLLAGLLAGQNTNRPTTGPPEYEALQAHFDHAVEARQRQHLHALDSRAAWEQRKGPLRAKLERSLWHDWKPPRGVPRATLTSTETFANYTMENIVIESAPGLYSTSNLYLPRNAAKPYPVILYQCGHASKNYYKKHGAWFAQNGIAALVMDNIEMGEVEFTHHGVYSNAWFHWYSRGFSPLAVELLNAKRAVDYLVSRPDLDPERIGATGRSGGGMTTFFLAALDDRIRASAPVSGTLSTKEWVKQRLTFAHCDCQFPINRYGLLYEEIGALIAPRPHLEANADADPGFPMNAFDDLIGTMRQAYKLYGAEQALQTAIAPGGHNDIEAIRLPVYSFFLREFLSRTAPVDKEGPIDEPPAERLVCYRIGTPLDERLTRADEALFATSPPPLSTAKALADTLRREVFAYFPHTPAPLDPQWGEPVTTQGRTTRRVTFTGLEGLRVKAVYSLPADTPASKKLPTLLLADHRRGIPVWGNEQPLERNAWGDRAVLLVETLDRGSRALERNLRSYSDNDSLHHMKRQAMAVGTTLESIQVYELLRALELLRTLDNTDTTRLAITGTGALGVNGLYAALLDGNVARVVLHSPPASHRAGPHYLGILRYTDIPRTTALLGAKVRVYGEMPNPAGTRCESLAACLQ